MGEIDLDYLRNAAAMIVAYINDDILEDDGLWEKITVNRREYLMLGDSAFQLHFRFTKPVFMTLSEELRDVLIENGSIRRERTPFEEILMMVLWILATPDTFRSVALRFGVHPSEVHMHYKYVVRGICELGQRYIKWPSAEERNRIKRNIQRRTGFPGIVGMLDGKHFSITQPVEYPVAYRNYHHGYSMKAQVVCDNRLVVRDVYIGEAGSLHDGRIFRRSPLVRSILYKPDMFANDEHIVADSAYPQLERVMTPFVNNGHLTELQRNYNRKLSRNRVKIEHLFCYASNSWRRTKHLHVRDMDCCAEHIASVFVLSNFRILQGEEPPAEDVNDDYVDEDEPVPDDQMFEGNDPYVPLGEAAALLRDSAVIGEQKRWNICNELPL